MRYALRSLMKSKGFALAAIVAVALGVGSTTAVFSVVDAVLVRPLPFADASRLFVLVGANPRRGISGAAFSYPAYAELAARQQSFSGTAAYAYERFTLTGVDRPEQLPSVRVSASFFDVLGVDAIAGRTFRPDEDRSSNTTVVVGRRFWLRHFNGEARAIGSTLTLNGAPFTVVGALGVDFPPPFDNVDIWATRPDELNGFTPAQVAAGLGFLSTVARLRADVPRERAQAELDTIEHGYARAHPTNTDADPDATLQMIPLREQGVGSVESPLLLLVGAVALVLIAACANVANLLLVRATARSHEAAVRMALGASRWDIARWLCVEALVLALAGGALGAVAAFWTVDLAGGFLSGLPRGAEIAVNVRALIFTLVVSVAAGLAFGLAPWRRATTQAPVDALRSGGRLSTSHRRGAAALLVVGEVAVSLVLLVLAGLLLQSFARLLTKPVGFTPENLLTMRVSLATSRYPDAAAMRSFMGRLTARLDATPGVASAAASMVLPPVPMVRAPYQVADAPERPIGERPAAVWSAITPRYFETMGIPLLEGRAFTDRDAESTSNVAIVSRALAARAWPNQSAIGKRLLVGRQVGYAEVVGVAGDIKNAGVALDSMPEVYTPYPQRPWPSFALVVRAAAGDPRTLVNSIRAAVAAVDPEQPLTEIATMDDALAGSIATARMTTTLLVVFAIVASAMAAAGLYGVIAYSVERRTREIGVRIALGASSSSVLRLVAADGLTLTLAGVVLGTIGAALASRAIRSQLFEISAADPATYAVLVAVFVAVAGLACFVPARRALRVDPIEALRVDG
jgi:putative ABC transport system permease protein